ncbi:MAG: FtsH protease activity modulator HflK [Pseudomonadota bacterium]
MTGNTGGPWGGGNRGSGGGGDNRGGGGNNGGRRPGNGDTPQIPEIDEIVKKGQEQLKVLMGGRGGSGGGGRGIGGPSLNRGTIGFGLVVLLGLWLFASFYTVRPEEQSVELFLGKYYATGDPGLNFAPWPLVTAEVLPVTRENTEDIGSATGNRNDEGLMLTTDENIVDIDFQVVWNIRDPAQYLFNLADGPQTVRAVSESAMREVIAASTLSPILNRDRGLIASTVEENIQTTLDSYESGINIVRVNLDKADPPAEVIDAFREVQAAEQERDRLERQADAYANRVLAGARGEAAQLLEEAEAYRARVVNEAQGEASRFLAVLEQYQLAPEVTRKRLYLETMEKVLGDVDKVILDDTGASGGQGVVPYLPLNEVRRSTAQASGGGN